MGTPTLRTVTHTLALVAAVLWLAAPAAAAPTVLGVAFRTSPAKATLKLKSLPTVKVPVELVVSLLGAPASGSWFARDDDGNEFQGAYYAAHANMRELGVVFDSQSLIQVAFLASDMLLGVHVGRMRVVSIALRPTVIKFDSKWKKVSGKLVFDLAAVVDGVYRVGTYEVPIKGEVLPN